MAFHLDLFSFCEKYGLLMDNIFNNNYQLQFNNILITLITLGITR